MDKISEMAEQALKKRGCKHRVGREAEAAVLEAEARAGEMLGRLAFFSWQGHFGQGD